MLVRKLRVRYVLTQPQNDIKYLGYCIRGSAIYNKSKSLLRFELAVTPLKPDTLVQHFMLKKVKIYLM